LQTSARKAGKVGVERVMSKQGIEFLEKWVAENVTEVLMLTAQGDAASFSIKLAERLIADAAKAGLSYVDDVLPIITSFIS
jgi:hypothetical protein